MTVDRLRELGHDVRDIRGTDEEGASDTNLWQRAIAEERILIATDKGFTQYRSAAHHGILVVRLHQPNRLKIHQSVLDALNRFPPEDWSGMLIVVRHTVMSISRG